MNPGGYRMLRWLIVALLAAAVAWALFALTTPRPPEPAETIGGRAINSGERALKWN